MPTVAWTLLAGLGYWNLRKVPKAKHKTLKALMVRLAAVLFLTAGTITAGGVIGRLLHSFVHLTGQWGAGLVWVLWFLGAMSWVAGMVAESWFAGDVPDWLSLSGLALPSLLASVPGPVGHGIATAMTSAHDTIGTGLASLVSVKA